MTQQHTQQPRYVQIPELIELFKDAPSFISNKAFKAFPLASNGELMVETQITEHMAAGLATVAQEVEAGEYALIHADYAHKALPYLQEDGTIAPNDLLNNHIEVMDVCPKTFLEEEAILDGPLGHYETNVYTDPLLQVLVAPEDMSIPSFMDPFGVEHIQQGQLLVRNSVLGVFPYERPHHSLTLDSTFMAHHLPVNSKGEIISLEDADLHREVFSAMASERSQAGIFSA